MRPRCANCGQEPPPGGWLGVCPLCGSEELLEPTDGFAPVPYGPARGVWLTPSRSQPGTARMTVLLEDGGWLCSCPATVQCWHIRQCREALTERTAP